MACVDIIIPLYNKEATIARTIQSIQRQTVEDWHIIVVDDGSTDGSLPVVEGISDKRIMIVRQENQGPGAARNRGIAEAKSDYLAFLDADDEWYEWYLENALKAMRENDVSVVGSMYHEWPRQEDMTKHWAKRNVHAGQYDLTGNEDPETMESLMLFFHVGNSLLKRDIASKYDGFYSKDRCLSGEDTIFFMRIVINEKVMIIAPPAVRHHRENSDLSNVLRPISPIVTTPDIVLDYCPKEKRDLMRRVIARLALRNARNRVRRTGLKEEAQALLHRFPEARSFRFEYYRCRYEMALSSIFPYWVKFKCLVGPPVRLFVKKLSRQLKRQDLMI